MSDQKSNVIPFQKRETSEERKAREQKELEAEILKKVLERAAKLGW
jgi:hypothetical protein